MNKKIFFHVLLLCFMIFSLNTLWPQEKKLFPIYLELSLPVFLNENGFFESFYTNTTYLRKGKSMGTTESNELSFQTYSLGWQFPRNKGKVILTYTHYEEKSSDTMVNHMVYDPDSAAYIIDDYFDPDLDFEFFDGPPNYIVKDLDRKFGMETTLYDIAFWKNFGKGKRFSGIWNAGFRFGKHDQRVPIGYFISFNDETIVNEEGFQLWGFGSNFGNQIFFIKEKCRSIGPKGGGIVNLYLFNKRLILSAGAEASLTFGKTEVPRQVMPIIIAYYQDLNGIPIDKEGNYSYDYIPLFPEDVGDLGELYEKLYGNNYNLHDLEPYTIAQKEDKSYWFTTVDLQIKIKIFKDLYAYMGYKFADFRNVILTPNLVNVPTKTDIPPDGLLLSYTFEDVSYRTPYFGISMQF